MFVVALVVGLLAAQADADAAPKTDTDRTPSLRSDLTMLAGGAAAGVVGGMLVAVPLVSQNRPDAVAQTAAAVAAMAVGAGAFATAVDLAGPHPWWTSGIVGIVTAAGTSVGVVAGGGLGAVLGAWTQSNTLQAIATAGGALTGGILLGAGAAMGSAWARDMWLPE
jgi:hypothetical protein